MQQPLFSSIQLYWLQTALACPLYPQPLCRDGATCSQLQLALACPLYPRPLCRDGATCSSVPGTLSYRSSSLWSTHIQSHNITHIQKMAFNSNLNYFLHSESLTALRIFANITACSLLVINFAHKCPNFKSPHRVFARVFIDS